MPFEMFSLLYETTRQLLNNLGLASLRVYNWSHQINYSISLLGKKTEGGVSTKQQKVAMDKVYN
jgi:hypothetical protein